MARKSSSKKLPQAASKRGGSVLSLLLAIGLGGLAFLFKDIQVDTSDINSLSTSVVKEVTARSLQYISELRTVLIEKGYIPDSPVGPKVSKYCGAEKFLSIHFVPGFHPICVTRSVADGGGLRVMAFQNGQNNTLVFNVEDNMSSFSKALNENLELEVLPPGSEPQSKYPWALFTSDGTAHITSLTQLLEDEKGLAFVFKGGNYIWPGISVGYTQTVNGIQGHPGGMTMTTLSMEPLVFSLQDFLAPYECDHIRSRSESHLAPAPVSLMDHDAGKANTNWRTSTNYFLRTGDDELLMNIDQRVSDLTRQPISHQEEAQVLRYEESQRYDAHHDYFNNKFYAGNADIMHMTDGGRKNRMITVFWYLSDVEEGGETVFPRAGGYDGHVDFRSCDKGLKVRPGVGKVAVFYSLKPDGQFDDLSLHGACPVIKGVKFAANKWVWNQPR